MCGFVCWFVSEPCTANACDKYSEQKMSTFEQNGSKNGAAFQPKKNQQGKRDRPHQDAIDVTTVHALDRDRAREAQETHCTRFGLPNRPALRDAATNVPAKDALNRARRFQLGVAFHDTRAQFEPRLLSRGIEPQLAPHLPHLGTRL